MNPDGLSYLELASNALKGGPSLLINGYWSPGYPALLAVAFLLFRPSAIQEFPLIHFVNFFIFIVTLWTFSVFFRHWLVTAPHGEEGLPTYQTRDIAPFAFSTFLWCTLTFIGTELVTPDLCVAAIVFLAAAISCRLCRPGSSWKHYAALGLVLGMGYYFKTAMLPLGIALLVLLLLLLPHSVAIARRKLFLSLCLSLSVLLVVVTPLIAALSAQANQLSFGESGRLNYAWSVNKLAREPRATPEHAAVTLLSTPQTLDFVSPRNSTYPFWYDPSYWSTDVKAKFDARQQIATLEQSLRDTKGILFFVPTLPLLSGAMVLFSMGFHERPCSAVPGVSWWQLAWALTACSMYALVVFEPRYVAPFLVLFWLAIYHPLFFRVNRRVGVAVLATVLFTVMGPFTFYLAKASAHIVSEMVRPRQPEYEIAALGLRDLGLQSDDQLAIVGSAYDCYYAHYDHLRVTSQIPDASQFWNLSAPELKILTESLRAIGVRALVVTNRPAVSAPADWKDVSVSASMRLSVLLLSPELGRT